MPGMGGGGCLIGSTNNINDSRRGGERARGGRWTSNGENGKKRKTPTENDPRAIIAVVVVELEGVSGVHGAPVFLGGQLFGFAIQVYAAVALVVVVKVVAVVVAVVD